MYLHIDDKGFLILLLKHVKLSQSLPTTIQPNFTEMYTFDIKNSKTVYHTTEIAQSRFFEYQF